jgi:hypothetical protein
MYNLYEYLISCVTASLVLWSEFLATDPEIWVRFSELPGFVRSSGSERGPLSLVSTTEEIRRKSSRSGLEIREYGNRDPSH